MTPSLTKQPVTTETTYTASQVIALTGASYRRLDHWCRTGYLPNDTASGPGTPRRFTTAEVDTIYAVVSLIAAGFTVPAAFTIARELVERDEYGLVVGKIFELRLSVKIPDGAQ